MADASPDPADAVEDTVKSLRSKCETASRFGVNGRYLILEAARKVAAAEKGAQQPIQQEQLADGRYRSPPTAPAPDFSRPASDIRSLCQQRL